MRIATDWKRATVSTLVLLLAIVGMASAQGPTIIVHNPVTVANPGIPLEIDARIEGMQNIGNVVDANVRFRMVGSSSWDFVQMEFSLDELVATIPAEAVTTEGLEYFIEAEMDDGSTITYPATGAESAPVSVTVRSGDEEAAIDSGVLILSPLPEETIRDTDLFIAVSFNPSVFAVNPEDVVLRLNGKDITKKAVTTEYLLMATLERVPNGRHRVDLLLKTGKQERLLRSWLFNYESLLGEVSYDETLFSGSLGLDGNSQQTNGVDQNRMRELVNVRMQRGDFKAQLYTRTTSEEQGNLQPQHRFRVTAGWPFFQVGLGDLTPKYSELALYGNRVRGAELKFTSGSFEVKGIYGEMRRGVNGYGYTVNDQITAAIVDSLGNVIGTETYNAYNYDPGTYKRNLAALRFGFGQENGPSHLGFTFMKVRDDTSSIDIDRPQDLQERIELGRPVEVAYTATPKDNLVVGTDFGLKLDRNRVQFKGEAALSLYNSNISERPLEDADNLKDVIWVNQYFEPLPAEGLTNDDGEAEVNTGELVSSVISNSLSWQGKLRLRYYGHDLRTGYVFLNRSFTSLGNPNLVNDDAGFYVYDRIRLFENRLYLNAGYRNFHNNVQNNSETTLTRQEISFGFTYITDPMYPDINFMFRNQTNENDGTVTEVITDTTAYNNDPTMGVVSFDSRTASTMNSFSVGLTHRVRLADTQSDLSLSYLMADRRDDYQDIGNSDMQFIGFTASTDYREYLPVTTRIVFSNSSQSSMDGLTELNYVTINLRGSYYLFDRTLVPYFNPNVTLGSGDYSLTYDDILPAGADPAATLRLQKIDYTRIDWVVGMEWRFMRQHTLAARISVSTYSDNGEYQYFDGSTADTLEDEIDRDDYSVLFSYIYRF